MNRTTRTSAAPELSRGFTLIELMIVLAIVAILAAIAYPSYRGSVLKSRRSDATVALTKAAQRLERCYTQFGGYDDAGCSIGDGDTIASDSGYYSIKVDVTGAGAYTLTATPTVKGGQNEDECEKYTLSSTSERGATRNGTSGAAAREACW